MVRYIFASHYRMADGLKETIEFLTSVKENVYAVSAYVTENYNIEEEIKKIFDNFTAVSYTHLDVYKRQT